MTEMTDYDSKVMRLLCDEILLLRKMNTLKHPENQNKCVGMTGTVRRCQQWCYGASDCKASVKQEFIKFAILSWEVGIWNEGVGSSSVAGV